MNYSARVLIAEGIDLLYGAIESCVHGIVQEAKIVHARDLASLRLASERAEEFALIVVDADLLDIQDARSNANLLQLLGRAPLAMLANSQREDDRSLALRSGVKAYLPKSAPRPVIMAGLGLAFCGYSFYLDTAGREVPGIALEAAFEGAAFEQSSGSARPITRRHREVLKLLAEGFTNAEIANRLGIAESTVRLHLREAYRRLGVRNRTQAVREVLRLDPNSR